MGWQAFQAGCYKQVPEKGDWDAGLKMCQKMEANLVSIHTLPEMEFILRNIKKGQSLLLDFSKTYFATEISQMSRLPNFFSCANRIRIKERVTYQNSCERFLKFFIDLSPRNHFAQVYTLPLSRNITVIV